MFLLTIISNCFITQDYVNVEAYSYTIYDNVFLLINKVIFQLYKYTLHILDSTLDFFSPNFFLTV